MKGEIVNVEENGTLGVRAILTERGKKKFLGKDVFHPIAGNVAGMKPGNTVEFSVQPDGQVIATKIHFKPS